MSVISVFKNQDLSSAMPECRWKRRRLCASGLRCTGLAVEDALPVSAEWAEPDVLSAARWFLVRVRVPGGADMGPVASKPVQVLRFSTGHNLRRAAQNACSRAGNLRVNRTVLRPRRLSRDQKQRRGSRRRSAVRSPVRRRFFRCLQPVVNGRPSRPGGKPVQVLQQDSSHGHELRNSARRASTYWPNSLTALLTMPSSASFSKNLAFRAQRIPRRGNSRIVVDC